MKDPVLETQNKSPVEIVQELLAIHTSRKEAAEKLGNKTLAGEISGELLQAVKQADEFIAALMNELSNYGDAVQAEADRENEYQVLWKNTMPQIDVMDEAARAKSFQALEDCLKKTYANILEKKTELPISLQELLTQQANRL